MLDKDELERLENDFKATLVVEDKDEKIKQLEWFCRVFIAELKMRV